MRGLRERSASVHLGPQPSSTIADSLPRRKDSHSPYVRVLAVHVVRDDGDLNEMGANGLSSVALHSRPVSSASRSLLPELENSPFFTPRAAADLQMLPTIWLLEVDPSNLVQVPMVRPGAQ